MSRKRVTIYDLALELGISASYVSRALNNHSSVNKKTIDLVKKKAAELNYKHNSHAANLRQGTSKTIGVIVPHINHSFFSDAIAGIEEICFNNNHSLIICQSHELYKQECLAVETLIKQNVDCILISISSETENYQHLEEIISNNIHLIQFDRVIQNINGFQVSNNHIKVSYDAVKSLIDQGYRKIAFLGGPKHISIFQKRKEGYIKAIEEAELAIPYNYIWEDVLSQEQAFEVASQLLNSKNPPDAFFNVSDHQTLGVLEVAQSLGIKIPDQLGLFGFANEAFTRLMKPSLSSIDQKSKELGKCAANLYFNNLLPNEVVPDAQMKIIIDAELMIRQSSTRQTG